MPWAQQIWIPTNVDPYNFALKALVQGQVTEDKLYAPPPPGDEAPIKKILLQIIHVYLIWAHKLCNSTFTRDGLLQQHRAMVYNVICKLWRLSCGLLDECNDLDSSPIRQNTPYLYLMW